MKMSERVLRNKALQDVLFEVRGQMQSTVLSYKQRDPDGIKWGSSGYPGNCSGKVPLGFIDKLGAESVTEVFAGSGTLSDVCRDFFIPYCGIDLNPQPVRKNIVSMDILDDTMDLPDAFHTSDMCFSHPPYPGINRIKYSGNAWKDTNHCANRDIQNMSFEYGMAMINHAHMRIYSAMQPGSYLVMLVGEIRSHGKYHSMYQNLALPGEVFQTYVKMQHNTWSGRQNYSRGHNPRAFTGHEMIAVIKKPSGYEFAYVIPQRICFDVRNSRSATWKDVVLSVMRNINTPANLTQIYSEIDGYKKAQANPHWKDKVRQILQQLQSSGLVKNISRGIWQLAA